MSEEIAYTVLRRRTQDGEEEVALNLTQEEYEQIVMQHTAGKGFIKKLLDNKKQFEEAKAMARPGEELRKENCSLAFSDSFEKAFVIIYCWAEKILNVLMKHKDFRVEIVGKAEDMRIRLYIYTDEEKETGN